ncbi:DUF192 domain-containing protein [Methanopyrus sp.]
MKAAVINRSKGTVLAYSAEIAESFLARLRGLMFRRKLEEGEGLILRPPYRGRRRCAIHTFFMRFPIDVVFLADGEVVDVVERLKPWRVYVPEEPPEEIVELPAGIVSATDTEVGDSVEVVVGDLESELAVRILNRKLVTRKLAQVIMRAVAKSGLQGEVFYNKDTGCIHISGEDKYIVADTIKETFGDSIEIIEGRAKILSDDHSLVVIVKDAHSVLEKIGISRPGEDLVYREEPKPVRWGKRREKGGADDDSEQVEEGNRDEGEGRTGDRGRT